MAQDERPGDHQSQKDSSSGGHECLYKHFMAIHPIVIEIFQSGPKWCWFTGPTTNEKEGEWFQVYFYALVLIMLWGQKSDPTVTIWDSNLHTAAH